MIILTDGLPNLAVGHNDLVTYNGLTDVINTTKSTLTSLGNVDLITMLTGIDNEEAAFRTEGENVYTYGQGQPLHYMQGISETHGGIRECARGFVITFVSRGGTYTDEHHGQGDICDRGRR